MFVKHVLETIIKEWIQKYLDANEILKTSQHSFRPFRLCLTKLLSFLDYVTEQLDAGEAVDIIYLDFSKALDKVPHMRLVHKMLEYKIHCHLVNWVENWLSNRKQSPKG